MDSGMTDDERFAITLLAYENPRARMDEIMRWQHLLADLFDDAFLEMLAGWPKCDAR
jgi:hypothetical protein